jgi:hypothetical protein
MFESLRSELKAIKNWPCGEMTTKTEKDAVAIRALRELELMFLVKEFVSRN